MELKDAKTREEVAAWVRSRPYKEPYSINGPQLDEALAHMERIALERAAHVSEMKTGGTEIAHAIRNLINKESKNESI